MAQLKSQKEKLAEDLKELVKKSRKGSELATVESQIKGLENRLKYSQKDLESSKKAIHTHEKNLKDLETELNAISVSEAFEHLWCQHILLRNRMALLLFFFIFWQLSKQPLIGEIERRMQKRNQKIEEIKQKMNTVEDRVYADFCKKIGVANIRQYEERELVLQQERAKMQADFDQQIDRITSRLDFERTKDTQGKRIVAFDCTMTDNDEIIQPWIFAVNVQRWERIISDEEDTYEKCKQNEEKQRAAIEEDKSQIEQLKGEKVEKKKEVDNMEKDVNKARHDVASLAKEIHNINYQVSSIDTKVETKKNEKHNILIQSKVCTDIIGV